MYKRNHFRIFKQYQDDIWGFVIKKKGYNYTKNLILNNYKRDIEFRKTAAFNPRLRFRFFLNKHDSRIQFKFIKKFLNLFKNLRVFLIQNLGFFYLFTYFLKFFKDQKDFIFFFYKFFKFFSSFFLLKKLGYTNKYLIFSNKKKLLNFSNVKNINNFLLSYYKKKTFKVKLNLIKKKLNKFKSINHLRKLCKKGKFKYKNKKPIGLFFKKKSSVSFKFKNIKRIRRGRFYKYKNRRNRNRRYRYRRKFRFKKDRLFFFKRYLRRKRFNKWEVRRKFYIVKKIYKKRQYKVRFKSFTNYLKSNKRFNKRLTLNFIFSKFLKKFKPNLKYLKKGKGSLDFFIFLDILPQFFLKNYYLYFISFNLNNKFPLLLNNIPLYNIFSVPFFFKKNTIYTLFCKHQKVLDKYRDFFLQSEFLYRLKKKLNIRKTKEFFYSVHISSPTKKKKEQSVFTLKKMYYKKLALYFGFIKPKKFFKFYDKFKKYKIDSQSYFYAMLEGRLETFLFRVNFLSSVYFIKQFIFLGNVFVNNRKITIPGLSLKNGEIISILKSKNFDIYAGIKLRLKKQTIFLNFPKYIEMDYRLLVGMIIKRPIYSELTPPFSTNLYTDFLSISRSY